MAIKEERNQSILHGGDNEESSLFDLESKECTNLALMASHHSDDEKYEISDEKLSYDNDAQEEIDEVLNEYKFYTKLCQLKRNKCYLL